MVFSSFALIGELAMYIAVITLGVTVQNAFRRRSVRPSSPSCPSVLSPPSHHARRARPRTVSEYITGVYTGRTRWCEWQRTHEGGGG